MEYISSFDTELFFLLNGLHTPWLDWIMYYASKTVTWIPLYLLLLYLIIKSFGQKSWIPLVCVVLCIVCTDQVTSGIMKPAFERLRPTHDPIVQHLVHTVNGYKGGRFGFASSHAANTFGIAFLCFLLLRSTSRWMVLLFIWAVVVSYTRIYLGVHYPGDLLVGAAIGLIFGWLMYQLNMHLIQTVDARKMA